MSTSEYTKLKSSEQAANTTEESKNQTAVQDSTEKSRKLSFPKDGYIHFVNRIKSCVEDAEDIDIYQYLAFKWKDEEATKFDKCRLTHEVIMCIIAQMVGIIVILKQVIEDGIEYKDSCNDSPIELKLLAFGLSSVAGYVSMEVFMHEKGMYSGGIADCIRGQAQETLALNLDLNLQWISFFWLCMGIWVNRIVSIGAVGGSFMVIFFSENAFDMVLNSVALFFLMELDNMLMTQSKYNDMCDFLSKWPENKSIEDIKKEYPEDTEFYSLARKEQVDVSLISCGKLKFIAFVCNLCCFACYAFFGMFFLIACIVVPVYIGVCY